MNGNAKAYSMFSSAVRKWKRLEQTLGKNKDPFYGEAVQLLRTRYANPNFKPPKGASREFRAERLTHTLELIESIASSADNIQTVHDAIADEVIALARVLVLTIQPEPGPDGTKLRGKPGITGELGSYADQLFGQDIQLISLHRKPHVKGLTAMEICILMSWFAKQRLQLLEALRQLIYRNPELASGPQSKMAIKNDWYRPFLHAACAAQEANYRKMLGLPDAFGASLIRGMEYSTFEILVRSCSPDPAAEFRETFKNK